MPVPRTARTEASEIANSPAATAYTSSGRTAKSSPPIAGPVTTAVCPATERSAVALGSSSSGTSSVASARSAGEPNAPETPVAAARARNGHSCRAPARVTTRSSPVTQMSSASDATTISLRERRSASCPAGSARSGSGTNSASPISPRSSGFRRIA